MIMSFELRPLIKKRWERKVFTALPLTVLIIMFAILLGTFFGITDLIVNSAPMVQIDYTFTNFLFHHRCPGMAKMFYFITHFADQITIVVLLVISLAYLYFKKEIAYLYALILTFLGAEGTAYLIKIFI